MEQEREILRLDRVAFAFPQGLRAVDDLSLQLGPGEVCGLIGPNGSGKSTVLGLVGGALVPDQGTVWKSGRVGWVPERIGFPPVSARSFLRGLARLDGASRSDAARAADRCLAEAGLEAEAARWPGEFSQGMRQRLLLAQALLGEPDLLLLDEPSAGLDPVDSSALAGRIRNLASQGISVLLASHRAGEIEEACDRLVFLRAGRIVEQCDAVELRNRWGGLARAYRTIYEKRG